MEKTRIAVIGCGAIANSAHIPAYQKMPDAQITYFCDILPERAKAAAETFGGEAVTDYTTLLDKEDVDAVSICTPNHMHAKIAIDFLRAGKDVLCEKPAARTCPEALEMQKAAHETGRVLNIGVCNRFNTAVNKIKSLIDAGELGDVFHVYISFRSHRSIPGLGGDFTTKAVAGGGALIDWGVHFLDLVMYCCGDPSPVSVTGEAFCRLGRDIPGYTYTSMWAGPPKLDGTYDVDDSVTALIRTRRAAGETGPVITLNGAWAQNIGEEEMFVDFMGDKAGVRLQYGKDFKLYTAKNGSLVTEQYTFTMENHYEAEIRSFLDCIRTGEKTAANIDCAILSSQIMQAIYDSSEAHQEIRL